MVDVEQPLTVVPASPESPDARRILWAYFDELASRYHRRQATAEEINGAMVEDPSDDLGPPGGLFLLAYFGAGPVGCVGLRDRPDRVGRVTRMFVTVPTRRRGLGLRLLQEVEVVGRQRGVIKLELDTRDDLVEARRLYLRFGFEEVPAFNAGRYADHWYSKWIA